MRHPEMTEDEIWAEVGHQLREIWAWVTLPFNLARWALLVLPGYWLLEHVLDPQLARCRVEPDWAMCWHDHVWLIWHWNSAHDPADRRKFQQVTMRPDGVWRWQ